MTPASGVKLKGGEPVSVRLRLDDDSVVELAAVEPDLLLGPFEALAVDDRESAR